MLQQNVMQALLHFRYRYHMKIQGSTPFSLSLSHSLSQIVEIKRRPNRLVLLQLVRNLR